MFIQDYRSAIEIGVWVWKYWKHIWEILDVEIILPNDFCDLANFPVHFCGKGAFHLISLLVKVYTSFFWPFWVFSLESRKGRGSWGTRRLLREIKWSLPFGEEELPDPSRSGTIRQRDREKSLDGKVTDTNNSPIVSDIKLKCKTEKCFNNFLNKVYFPPIRSRAKSYELTLIYVYYLFSKAMVRNFTNLSISCGWKVALYIINTDRVTNIICRAFLLLAVLSRDI